MRIGVIVVVMCLAVAAGAAHADRVVVGYRTLMSAFPFYAC